MAISAPSTSRRKEARPTARRGRFGVLGDAKLAGLVGLVGLILALIGVIIAFLSWRGDERDRAAKANPEPRNSAAVDLPAAPISPPASGVSASAAPTHGPAAVLSYRLAASPVDARTVTVTTTPTGLPAPGMTYWFMVEVNWGDGNIDYYPRRRLDDQASTFDVTIPVDASTDFARTGRVYALNEEQSNAADVRLARQGAGPSDNDFFADRTGQAVSNGVRLPF
ncbi:hypothetical protein [Paractinoplanes globisporus]|uniref:Uncharacterized protein n=1 Tax=Paractinoplanes globisporus TaxID=113565 RepID=A0ABW6W6Q9_9ACTN|nr:hypothetical protein [Actinoplanes globisporus]